MVIITLVYVIATIFISYFNWKSSEAAREQIMVSQKQQTQNVGLQLYDRRSEVIQKVGKYQFNEVYWDVSLLFDEEIFREFEKIGNKNSEFEELKANIKKFEDELALLLPRTLGIEFNSKMSSAKAEKEYCELEAFLKRHYQGVSNNNDVYSSINQYISNLKRSDELKFFIDGKTTLLIMKLRSFIKNSIRQEVVSEANIGSHND